MTHSKQHSRMRAGFSLVDTMVAVALFSIVVVMAVGSLVSLVAANRKARSQSVVINDVNAVIDSISRGIRSGHAFHCGTGPPYDTEVLSCAGGSQYFAYEAAGGDNANPNDQVVFRLNTATHRIERSLASGAAGTWEAVTGSDVDVEDLRFEVITFGAPDEQPKVSIRAKARSGNPAHQATQSDIAIQTTVGQRLSIVSTQQAIVGGSSRPQNPICPIEAGPGRYFISFEVGKANATYFDPGNPSTGSGCRLQLGPYTPQAPIPAGTYDVILVSFDTHCIDWPSCNNMHPTQLREQYRLRMPAGSSFASTGNRDSANIRCSPESGCIPDIPDDQQTVVAGVGSVTLSAPVSSGVYAEFGWGCNGTPDGPPENTHDSLVPACAVLQGQVGGFVSTPIDIEEF